MILVLAGTADAREVIQTLKSEGYQLAATTVTSYGAELAQKAGADFVHKGALKRDDIINFIQKHNIKAVVDATHPFAVQITRDTRESCKLLGLPYYRYRRPEAKLPSHPNLFWTKDWNKAVELAACGQVIFLTIGSRNLNKFTLNAAIRQKRLVVRILPEVNSLARCHELGISTKNIVALHGPFTYELNKELYRFYGVDVVVTKDSGTTGGVEAKVQAALDLGLKVIVISRPVEPDSLELNQIIQYLRKDQEKLSYRD
ncbi:MAG: precorrin-6A/cobalt-precorrin-6A reductase [Clostridia bacterium]|nr:precorrin-6A/cobalt-precorrin-6A reductase [Clostridia bacterium]